MCPRCRNHTLYQTFLHVPSLSMKETQETLLCLFETKVQRTKKYPLPSGSLIWDVSNPCVLIYQRFEAILIASYSKVCPVLREVDLCDKCIAS